jgi:hypothetical protein
MSITVNQGNLFTIPPGAREVVDFIFDMPAGTSVATKTVTKTLIRGNAADTGITLGTPDEAAGVVSVSVTSATEGQFWEVKCTITTNENPSQTFISMVYVNCETPRV